MRTSIDAKGRIVIPKAMREAAGIGPGAEVDISFRGGHIEIEPAEDSMRRVDGEVNRAAATPRHRRRGRR